MLHEWLSGIFPAYSSCSSPKLLLLPCEMAVTLTSHLIGERSVNEKSDLLKSAALVSEHKPNHCSMTLNLILQNSATLWDSI